MRAKSISDRLPFRLYMSVLLFSVFGTILQRTVLPEPTILAPICSALMLLSGVVVVLANVSGDGRRRAMLAGMGLLVIGAAAEIVGLYTQVPFGYYRYTTEWAPTVTLPNNLAFPLLLPIAWVLIVGAATLVVPIDCPIRRPVVAAVLATVIDFFMEPTMIHVLNYWTWPSHEGLFAPVSNSFGWFVTALIGSTSLQRVTPRTWASVRTKWVLAGYLFFVAFLGMSYWLPSLILVGIGLVILRLPTPLTK